MYSTSVLQREAAMRPVIASPRIFQMVQDSLFSICCSARLHRDVWTPKKAAKQPFWSLQSRYKYFDVELGTMQLDATPGNVVDSVFRDMGGVRMRTIASWHMVQISTRP